MSDILSPVLAVMENEVDAFWCFVGLMNRVVSSKMPCDDIRSVLTTLVIPCDNIRSVLATLVIPCDNIRSVVRNC